MSGALKAGGGGAASPPLPSRDKGLSLHLPAMQHRTVAHIGLRPIC